MQRRPQPHAFWGVDAEGRVTSEPAEFVLVRVAPEEWERARLEGENVGRYRLTKPFAYCDARSGATIIVPANLASFTSDLASVPIFAAWLVPRDGIHAPAAILHDALVQSQTSPVEPIRERSDDIFREAMRALGVRLLRRWMMWAAVSLLTMAKTSHNFARWVRTISLFVVCVALLAVGFLSILDVFDVPGFAVLPWMGHRSVGLELVNGAIVAAICAAVVPVLFFPRPLVGLVAALGLIPLAFPLVVVALTLGAYLLAEGIVGRVDSLGS
jgi:hypothetical protein